MKKVKHQIKEMISVHLDNGVKIDNYIKPGSYIQLMEDYANIIHEIELCHLEEKYDCEIISQIIHKYATCLKNQELPTSETLEKLEFLYIKALKINPDNFHANLALAMLYHKFLKNPQKAELYKEKARILKDAQPNGEHLGLLFEIFP